MSEVILTDDSFENEVLKSEIPVLVDFWAEWCGPCRMLTPVIGELATEYTGTLKVAKCNVDACPESSQKYQIQSIPTLKLFHKGVVVEQTVGVSPKEAIISMFKSYLD